MNRIARLLPILVAGCFSPTPTSGLLLCSTEGECPPGFRCIDDRCWKSGTGPDLSIALEDDGGADLSMSTDASDEDAMDFSVTIDAALDQASPVDQALPFDAAVPSLEGAWVTACRMMIGSGWHIRTISFAGNQVVDATVNFLDAACNNPTFVDITRYTFALVGAAETVAGAWKMDETVIGSFTACLDDSCVTDSNGVNYCGISDWKLWETRDISGRSCVANIKAGDILKELVKVDGTSLQIGNQSGTAGTPRPTMLNATMYNRACDLFPHGGCGGGDKCGLPKLITKCLTNGVVAVGQQCNPMTDTCVGGALCPLTPDGGSASLCRRPCVVDSDCPGVDDAGTAAYCRIAMETTAIRACTLQCNPIPSAGSSGCPGGLSCKVLSVSPFHTECVKAGTATEGQSCASALCADGLGCFNQKCWPGCRTGNNSDCPPTYNCQASPYVYSVCCPPAGCV